MLALATRTRHRLGPTRAVLESTVATAGITLGATAGLGTVIFAVSIGPAIELTMTLLAKTPATTTPERTEPQAPANQPARPPLGARAGR
jgi:uncharacterized membrane protein YczE